MDNLTDLERKQYACSIGSKQMPLTALHLSGINLKNRQRLDKMEELGDLSMNIMTFHVPTLEDFMNSPLAKLITFSVNDCSHCGSNLLKAKTAAGKEVNPNWWEAMHDLFADECQKAGCMRSWKPK